MTWSWTTILPGTGLRRDYKGTGEVGPIGSRPVAVAVRGQGRPEIPGGLRQLGRLRTGTRRGWPNRVSGPTRSFKVKGTCLSRLQPGRCTVMKMAGLPKLTRRFRAIPTKTASGFFCFFFFTEIEMLVPKFTWKRTGPMSLQDLTGERSRRSRDARSAGRRLGPGSASAPSTLDSASRRATHARCVRGTGGPGGQQTPA